MKQVHKINNGIDYIYLLTIYVISCSTMPIVLNKHCSEHYINCNWLNDVVTLE